MSVPIEKIVPGVWGVSHPIGDYKVVEVSDNLTCVLNAGGEYRRDQVRYWVLRGWQFTRRYIPCDGEPVPLWAVSSSDPQRDFGVDYFDSEESACDYAAGMTENGSPAKIDRGVFIPAKEPSDA